MGWFKRLRIWVSRKLFSLSIRMQPELCRDEVKDEMIYRIAKSPTFRKQLEAATIRVDHGDVPLTVSHVRYDERLSQVEEEMKKLRIERDNMLKEAVKIGS
jgi:hypothetical protein